MADASVVTFRWYPFKRGCDLSDPPKYDNGVIVVREDGSLELTPDDPHYYGEISRDEACRLAFTILKHLLASAPLPPPALP